LIADAIHNQFGKTMNLVGVSSGKVADRSQRMRYVLGIRMLKPLYKREVKPPESLNKPEESRYAQKED
jgi:hypothetical protein